MRDPRRGVQLHFRGSDGPGVNVHIDLHNPGDKPDKRTSALAELPGAATHFVKDLLGWKRNHSASAVLAALERSGVRVPRPGDAR